MQSGRVPRALALTSLVLSASHAGAAAPPAVPHEPSEHRLVLSYELTFEIPPRAAEPAPEPGDGLALQPIRELHESAQLHESAPAPVQDTAVAVLTALVIFLFASIALLLGFSLFTRALRERANARQARFNGRWEPVLHAMMAGDDVTPPPLARGERILFILLWLRMMGYVRDDAAHGLIECARKLDMARILLRMLDSGSPQNRLLAMRMAGALRVPEAVAALQRKAAQRRPRSSLEAAAALLKIDASRGFDALRELLAHLEWSPGAMVGVIRLGGEGATPMLSSLLATLPAGAGKQVVRLIELLEDHGTLPALRERLLGNRDEGEIAVLLHALGKLGGASDRAAMLPFLRHRGWPVRMQAASALGVLGLPADGERLAPLLRDPQWWVRYRAAQALFRLRGADFARALHAAETDPYAREILARVLAEG